ncbi:iron ABC transporter permease [Corynebacterium amycolatum]|uniref:Iron ABC transporter permease n=1 Tax=Corynebacterium amycolatum TaxID=43765 RepID=A0AB37GDM1_CORAY|nr:iron ABC transporter permease [Corynebacterium amycolatum]QQB81770.1 iron ABC transporter permease [Corynebacterium amycolatum]QQU99429.1 iron ABC transporter permease [Corynebacterium amycolatum]
MTIIFKLSIINQVKTIVDRASLPRTRKQKLRARLFGFLFFLAVPATILLAISIGPAGTGFSNGIVALLTPLINTLSDDLPALNHLLPEISPATQSLVWSIRLPRVLLAGLVGASLAVAGATMQAVFRNPLAEPGVTGVSSGAAVVAVILIVTGVAAKAPWVLSAGAFIGALLAVIFVQIVAGLNGGSGATLLLVGIALNAFLGAVIAATIANAPHSDDAQQAMFWLNGDLTAANWQDIALAVGPITVGTVILMMLIPELNLLLLGEEQAAATGMRTVWIRQLLLALAALVTAAGVAVTGVISFVGLVVPHLIRLAIGPDHRSLLPISMCLGAVFLILADLVARSLFFPVALQTGTVTAFLGAPALLALILRQGGRQS